MTSPPTTPHRSKRSGGAAERISKVPTLPPELENGYAIYEAALAAGTDKPAELTFPFGLDSLDTALHNRDQALYPGVIPGELWIYAAPSGNGKSVFSQIFAAASATVLEGAGLEHCRVLYILNEDSAQWFRRIDTTASVRIKRFIDRLDGKASLELYGRAYVQYMCYMYWKAEQMGVPFSQARPMVVIIDYLQSIKGDAKRDHITEVVADSAKMMAEGNLRQFAERTGVDFDAICVDQLGYVPDDIEGHKVAVLMTAQYRKGETKPPFNPDNPTHQKNVTDYVPVADGQLAWEPRLGDKARQFARTEMEGRATITNHATGVLEGFRPNPADKTDSRYVIVTDKMRNGQQGVFVMAWGTAIGANAGLIYDPKAQTAAILHLQELCECFQDPDPQAKCYAASGHPDGTCDCVDANGDPTDCTLTGLDIDTWVRDSVSPGLAKVPPGEMTRCAPLIRKRRPRKRSLMEGANYS